jgi:hypothetical protein
VTVIAYRDGVMAGDRCWSDEQLVVSSACKLRRLSGKLYGGAGDSDDRALVELLTPVQVPAELPTRAQLAGLGIDASALLVFSPYGSNEGAFPFGRVFVIEAGKGEDTGIYEVRLPFIAIGSGREVAMGAMAAGADAKRAAMIACDLVTTCRLPVDTLELL